MAGVRGLPLSAEGPGAGGEEDAGGAAGLPGRERAWGAARGHPLRALRPQQRQLGGSTLGGPHRRAGPQLPPGDPGPAHAPPRLGEGSEVARVRHTLPCGGSWGPDLCPEAWVGADARVTPLSCPPGASLGWGLLVSGSSPRLGVGGEGPDPVACVPLLSLQPTAQGAFLRGSGLSLPSGRFTAPVTAIFQFFASLHVGERGQARVHVGGWGLAFRVAPDVTGPRPGSHCRGASCSHPDSPGGWTGPHAHPPQPAVCPEAPQPLSPLLRPP